MQNRFVHIAIAVAMTCSAASNARANSPSIYRFIDDRGVVHFSNAPSDPRYRAIKVPRKVKADGKEAPKPWIPVNDGYDSLIIREAKANRLEPALVKAVIAAESNFSAKAVSRVGAQGLMQLMPKTAAGLGVQDSFEAPQNVSGGSRYLRAMLDRYGNLSWALAAYNAGPKAVDRYQGVPPYPETKAYVKRVLAYYRGYRGDF